MATVLYAYSASQLGEVTRQARLDAGISQSELAQRSRVGRQWLNAFEAGDKPTAPLDMIMRVAEALGVELVLAPARNPAKVAAQGRPRDVPASSSSSPALDDVLRRAQIPNIDTSAALKNALKNIDMNAALKGVDGVALSGILDSVAGRPALPASPDSPAAPIENQVDEQ